MTLHLEMTLRLPLLPLSPRREVQTRRLIRLATDIPRANNGMAIRHRKVEQTPRLNSNIILSPSLTHKLIDPGNSLHHDLPQQRLPKAVRPGIRAGIDAFLCKEIEEQRKGPFTVCPALDAQVPLVGEGLAQGTLDVVPSADVTVVHPHEGVVLEWVAVVVGKSSLRRSADVSKD